MDHKKKEVKSHAMHAEQENLGNIILRATDTDIMVILLMHEHLLKYSKIRFDTGHDSKNTQYYLDVFSLAKEISSYTQALAGIYSLTGCDYSPFFYCKGKVKPIALMLKDDRFVEAFLSLGSTPLDDNTANVIEEFVCHMYGCKCVSVNEAIFQLFSMKNAPKSTKGPLDYVKKLRQHHSHHVIEFSLNI